MRRLSTFVLVAAAAAVVTLTTGGSAYAGGTQAPTVSPASVTTVDVQGDDMMGGCRKAHKFTEANPING